MAYERRSILAFVQRVADATPPGAVVLDVGAGKAPYRELFAHCRYLTTDWTHSVHERSRDVDFVASADALPLEDEAIDAVLLTQVLEHVSDPAAALREAARVLRTDGTVYVTVPFVWELHELPYDFWRFTPASLEQLLTGAGFVEPVIEARNDCFTTGAQLLRDERTPLLYLAPWVDVGGSDKGTIDWFRFLDRDRFRPSLITTQPSANRRLDEVVPFADEVWDLPQLMAGDDFARFIVAFILTRRPQVIHIMNAR